MYKKYPVEILRGTGLVTVEGGGEIGVRSYALQHWRHVQITENGTVTTWNEVGRSMTGTIAWSPDDLQGRLGTPLTIALDDGRRQRFLVRSSLGDVEFTGPCE